MAFSFYRTITVNSAQVPSTQSSFPMLVSGTYGYLATVGNGGKVQNSNGYDIGFYADSGLTMKLDWEIEKYVPTSGEVDYWINIASISNGSVIYMAYGDASITTNQSNPTAVWDSNFKSVYHLPDGTTLTTLDSTSNANNLSNTNVTAGSGQIDGAGVFTTASFLDMSTPISFPTSMTMEMWLNPSSLPALSFPLDRTSSVAIAVAQFFTGNGNSSDIFWRIRDNGAGGIPNVQASSVLSVGTWMHVAGVRDIGAGLIRIYINGAQNNTASDTSSGTITITNPRIGSDANGFNTFPGSIDEWRISTIARGADWIATEYNNQSAPSSFYTVGSEIPTATSSTITGIQSITGISSITF